MINTLPFNGRITRLKHESHYAETIAAWILEEWPQETHGESIETLGRRLLECDQKGLSIENKHGFSVTFVAVQAGEIVGTVRLCSHDMKGPDDDFSPWLAALYVHPSHRQKHIGRALVENTVTTAIQLAMKHVVGHRSLHLWFPASKSHLLTFYCSCGFHEIARSVYKESSFGEDVVIMRHDFRS